MSILVTELVSDVKNELGFNFSSEAHNDTKLKTYVNKWIRKLDKAADWIHRVKKTSLVTSWASESYQVPFQKQTLHVLMWWDAIEYSNHENYYVWLTSFWIQEDTVLTKMVWTFEIVYRSMTDRISSVVSWTIDLPEYCYEALYHVSCYYWFMNVKNFESMREHERLFNEELERLKRTFWDIHPNEFVKISWGYKFV